MENNKICEMSLKDFFNMIFQLNGISKLNLHLVELISKVEKITDVQIQKFLVLVLSLQDDGNIQFALDERIFGAKWKEKWNSLIQLAGDDYEFCEEEFFNADDFDSIINGGIEFLLQKDLSSSVVFSTEKNGSTTFLYIKKYFKAKVDIEDRFKKIFTGGEIPDEQEIKNCINELKKINPKFKDNIQQAEAIIRGQRQNLLITGGPGSGKTTVVLYLLWNLLKKLPDMDEYNIHLAAPSGKAADRMVESLKKQLSNISSDEINKFPNIYSKLRNLESKTIHRLLKINLNTNTFNYNKDNQFDSKSIFVIDEASMIDIVLFSSLLNAIPDNAKVFILGDPNQLPSVNAGAVLGDLLNAPKENDCIVRLLFSTRFTDDSQVGILASYIKECALSSNAKKGFECSFKSYEEIRNSMKEISNAKNNVEYLQLDAKTKEKQIKSIVEDWYNDNIKISAEASNINPLEGMNDEPVSLEQETLRKNLWELSNSKRILCAERNGPCGVSGINSIAKNYLRSRGGFKKNGSYDYFPGELIIITTNLKSFRLYNGDTGIVIFKDNIPFLMVKKQLTDKEKQNSEFLFYKMSLLPTEALEDAYGITIHKSQGSEYNHVMVVLPSKIGHPLLNNQILYTGVTRAIDSAVIVSDKECFDYACRNITKRDTGIML